MKRLALRFLGRRAVRLIALLCLIAAFDLWLGGRVTNVEHRVTVIEQRSPRSLIDEVDTLRGEVGDLQAQVRDLRARLGTPGPSPAPSRAVAPTLAPFVAPTATARPATTSTPRPTPTVPTPRPSPSLSVPLPTLPAPLLAAVHAHGFWHPIRFA